MLAVHIGVGVIVLVTSLAAGLWGGYAWYRQEPSEGFWYLLRVAQIAVVAQALVGTILLLTGREALDGLHYLYGVLPVMVSMLAEAARAGAGDESSRESTSTRSRASASALLRWRSSAARRESWPSRLWSSSAWR